MRSEEELRGTTGGGGKRIAIAMSGAFGGQGIPRVVESWARMLGVGGHQVTVISQDDAGAREFPAMVGVQQRLSRIPDDTPHRRRLYTEARSVNEILAELQRTQGLDLICSHNSLLTAQIRSAFPAAKILHTVHSPLADEHRLTNWRYAKRLSQRLAYPLTRRMLSRLDSEALECADRVHTLSDYTWNILQRRYPAACAGAAWSKIPGTFDDRTFVPPDDRQRTRRELGIGDDETILLTVRRLVPRNGVDRIVSAARDLGDRMGKARFVIGGTGELKSELEQATRAAGLQSRISFVGFVPEEQLASYYQAADLFVLPTRELECFGLPVIEAMGCGTPAAVMPDGGPAEICREHPEFVARANSGEAFTELIASYLEGRIPRRIEQIDSWARREYSEQALRPSVLRLVAELAG